MRYCLTSLGQCHAGARASEQPVPVPWRRAPDEREAMSPSSRRPPASSREEPASRAQSVYRAIRKAILEQALKPAMKLPEDAIGEKLGVSRTLVREALVRLAIEGLVEIKTNRGARVAYPTLEEARDVFDVRRGLERQVADLLAGRLTAEQVHALEAHVLSEVRVLGRDGPESIRLAGEFSHHAGRDDRQRLLLRYVQEVSSRCSLILAIYGRPHSSECAVSEHRGLIEALKAGDATRAASLMDEHLSAVVSRALIAHRAEPDLGDSLAPYARDEGLAKP